MEPRRRTWRRTAVVLAALLLTLAASRVAAADTLTLIWDANSDPTVTGYIVYVGTQPGTYTQNFNVGSATSYSFTTAVPGQLYCFAVSAYAAGPIEGAKSAEVCGYSDLRPTLTNPGAQSSTAGQSDSLQLVGSDPDGLAVTYSATGLPPGLTLGSSTGFISGTPTTAGPYSVTATVSDSVLTASQTFSWTVGAGDTTAPTISITAPTSSATYATSSTPLTVSGTAADAVGVTQVSWVNDRGGSGVATGTTSWSVTGITLQSGTNVITVTARDAANNTRTASLTVTYTAADTTAPAVSITTPTSASTHIASTTPLTVGGTSSDAVGVTQVTWANSRGGTGTAIGTTTWNASGITLLGGSNVITITARDAAGNTSTDTLTVTYNAPDTTAPAAAITTPTSAATHSTSTTPLTVGGTASDAVGVTQVTWANDRGGSGTATGTTNWSASGVVLQSGSNVITITARDAAGNSAIDTLTVTYTPADTANPTVAISTPTPNATHTATAATMSLGGTASDNASVTQVTWSNSRGGSGTATGTTSWSVATISLQDGSNTLTVTARDAAGNSATDVLTVTYNAPDTTAPVVAIAQPTSASAFSATTAPVSVSGTSSDAVGVTQVTWANDRGGSGTATGTTSWSANGVTLQSGSNLITITARDGAGNTATDTLTITLTLPLTVSSLTANQTAPQPTGTPITFTATATNGTAPYSYKWWLFDGANWTIMQNWSTSNTYTWTPTVANSAFRVSVWVRNAGSTADIYDNSQSNYSIAFPVNSATPALSVTGLSANRIAPQPVGTPITFTAAVSGGTAPQQFKWMLFDGSNTSVVQGWSSNNTWTWTPSTANAAYQVTVWARSAASTTDAAENANSTRSLPFAISATPLTLTGLTANLPAPQAVGTPVTFTAAVSGGIGPHQFKWWVSDGQSWTALQNWSTSNTWTWTPTSAGGNTRVAVWVRNAGNTADAYDNPAANGSIAFGITGGGQTPAPLTVTNLTANRVSPQSVGTPITFSAAVSGGTAPQQFKWMLFDGSNTSVVQGWSTSNTWTWTPTTADAYQVTVWARSAASTTDAAENANSTRSLPFAITATSQGPLTLTSLTSNLPAPQPAGTPITFTATVSGGVAPHQYKWWVFDGKDWLVTQTWSASNTWTWTPATSNNKTRVAVWVRNMGSTADAYDNPAANGSIGFAITGGNQSQNGPLKVASLTADRTAPQMVGAAVTFTATVSGGSTPYQYKWWVFDGIDWTVVQPWSSSNTFVWTPTTANAEYRVSVWVRNAGTFADTYDNNANPSISFPISPLPPSPPLLLTAINANLTSPQPVGASITFTALAIGGSGNYQYKWWIFDGTSWTVATGWNNSNGFTWTPGASGVGYRVAVWVRNASSTTDAYDNPSSNGSIGFVIQ
jgi:Putative Ig domain/Glucodextranase, domain B